MTVKELIAKLESVQNKEKEVVIIEPEVYSETYEITEVYEDIAGEAIISVLPG
jgi:FtsZ-interacting cell division protein YlmF